MHPSYARDRPTSRPALYEFTLVKDGGGAGQANVWNTG